MQRLGEQVELTFSLSAKEVFGVQHLFDAMTNPKVGAVLVTGDDENNRDRQVMVSHIRQPQRLRLRMETAQNVRIALPRP